MRESADADVIFVASGLSNSHMFNSFSHQHDDFSQIHKERFISLSWCKRNLQREQEENIFLPCVQKYSAPSKQECHMRHECSEIALSWNVCKIVNTPLIGFLSQHRNHVDCFLLLRNVNCSGCFQGLCVGLLFPKVFASVLF